MAANDWQTISGSLAGDDIAAGISSGLSKPNGGGSFNYVARSLTGPGVFARVALPQGQGTFDPMVAGGLVSAAMKASAGASVAMFLGLQSGGSPDVSDAAYKLGIGADGHIELRKGPLNDGGVLLARGTATIAPDVWVHLQLEVVCNPHGDVVLNVFANDLSHPVTSPVWVGGIPGFAVVGATQPGVDASFLMVDDPMGINSGSPSFVGGRAGFVMSFAAKDEHAAIDHFKLARQA